MDLKAILKNQGYTDEQIQAVLNAMKDNGIYTSSVKNPDETIKKLQEDNEQLKAEKKDPQKSAKEDESVGELIKQMQDEVRRTKIETAAAIGLTKAGALDVDYLMFKAEKSGDLQKLKVGEDGNITGMDELVSGLQKNYAAYFTETEKQQEALSRVGIKKLEDTQMLDDDVNTLEEAIAQNYSGEE